MTDTAQLRALLAKMTPGEWSVAGKTTGYISCSGDPKTVGYVHIATVGAYQDKELLRFNRDRWDADAAGIVALVNAAEPMLDEIDRLRAEVTRLREASGYWRSEDREFGYPDLNDLLDGYEQDEIVQITPWRDLPDGFAAWTEEHGWAFYNTEAEARAALGEQP